MPGPLPPVPLVEVEDLPTVDSLLTQVAFMLPDGSRLAVAAHDPEDRDGLRLYHYHPSADGGMRVLACSSPAYDSYTMFPSVFAHPERPWPLCILASLGEKNSWGQKVILLDSTGFHDLGFIDMAVPELRDLGDTIVNRLASIAPFAQLHSTDEGINIRFLADSVHLYDDLRGHFDVRRAGSDVGYTFLWQGGTRLHDREGTLAISAQP